jgi:hypothetical protein
VAGGHFDVEVDLDIQLGARHLAMASSAEAPRIARSGDAVHVRALVEAVDDDGVVTLRLARDCIILLECEGGLSVGDVVRFDVSASQVRLTPIGR